MTATIVLPCYNPAHGWEKHVVAVFKSFVSSINEIPELIIVFDGECKTVSPIEISYLTAEINSLKSISYPENKGKGYALRKGIEQATGDIILYTDIDFPYSTVSMMLLYNGLKNNNYDVGIGVKDKSYYANVPYLRRVISYFLRFLIRSFLAMPITDTQCGLKGFSKEVKQVFLNTTINRYLFDLEFVRNCYKAKKYRIQPVSISLNENIHFRKMNYRILLPELYNFIKLLFKH